MFLFLGVSCDKKNCPFVLSNLESIVSPAPKLHDTGLLVKWEIFNIHLNILGFKLF